MGLDTYWSEKVLERVPQRIREARRLRGVTQELVAYWLGIRAVHISHLECGRKIPSVAMLMALSDALGVTADYLLGLDQDGESGESGERAVGHVSE